MCQHQTCQCQSGWLTGICTAVPVNTRIPTVPLGLPSSQREKEGGERNVHFATAGAFRLVQCAGRPRRSFSRDLRSVGSNLLRHVHRQNGTSLYTYVYTGSAVTLTEGEPEAYIDWKPTLKKKKMYGMKRAEGSLCSCRDVSRFRPQSLSVSVSFSVCQGAENWISQWCM